MPWKLDELDERRSSSHEENSQVSNERRLALFLDGTWNTTNDDTNIWRMRSLCPEMDNQLRYYSAGVGTQRGERVIGGMFGYGLDAEVISAYEWLVEHYVNNDRIYLFGFSRGAFTARSLAGLVSKCGLLVPGSPVSLNQLYDRYRRGKSVPTIRQLLHSRENVSSEEDQWLVKYSRAIPIFFQGVYDTVGALGVPLGEIPVLSRSNYSFLETDLRINDSFAFHALAIDEHRKAFAPTLWTRTVEAHTESYPPRSLASVEQRWFVGAHADVGGGYPNGLLAQLPLRWLMKMAARHGLIFQEFPTIDGDENRAGIHDSFREMASGVYAAAKLWRPYLRRLAPAPLQNGARETSTINETIDASVFDRWRRDSTYRPRNLINWAKERVVEIDALQCSVLANSPSTSVDDHDGS